MDKRAEHSRQPVSALLGLIEAQLQLGSPSIDGKGSVSNTFGELTVPLTLVAPGVTTADSRNALSPEFKATDEYIYYAPGRAISQEIDFDLAKANLAKSGTTQKAHHTTSASAVKYGSVVESLALAALSNHAGVKVELIEFVTSLTA